MSAVRISEKLYTYLREQSRPVPIAVRRTKKHAWIPVRAKEALVSELRWMIDSDIDRITKSMAGRALVELEKQKKAEEAHR